MHNTATRKQSLAVRYVMSLCCHVAKIIIVFQGLSQKKNIMTEAMSMVNPLPFEYLAAFLPFLLKKKRKKSAEMKT